MRRPASPLTCLAAALALAAAFGGGFGLGRGGLPAADARGPADGWRTFDEVREIVEREYYDRSALDHRRLGYGAVDGLLKSLGDPYAALVPPAAATGDGLVTGAEGTGIVAERRDGQVVVARVEAGSPGERAGVRTGDVIGQVDGRDAPSMRIEEVQAALRANGGGRVALALRRGGATVALQIEAPRAEARRADPVFAWIGPNAYIGVPAFGPGSADALAVLVRRAVDGQAEGIVLDLRDNPGGYLDAAVAAAGLFLRDGVVLYQQNGDGSLREHAVKPGGAPADARLVVVVNGGTASAAEVLAAALRGHQRTVLIGEPTYGKGSVQSVHRLGDGASLRLTVAHWLTPAREDLSGRGLTPDVYVRGGPPARSGQPVDAADPALAAALARLRR